MTVINVDYIFPNGILNCFFQNALKQAKVVVSPNNKTSPSPAPPAPPSTGASVFTVKSSPVRRPRGEAKKCRKVYGMEHREQWCTQCKWKKACTRFGE